MYRPALECTLSWSTSQGLLPQWILGLTFLVFAQLANQSEKTTIADLGRIRDTGS